MQSSILCPVEIQKRHSATVHIFAVLILIWKLKFPGIFCQMLAQVFDLKLKTEIFPVLLCRKFLYDLLNGTGVTSVICKEKFRTGSQHIILIQQSITVHAARKFIALCRDVLKDLNIHLLLRCRFFHLCPILVNVHVFVRKTEQVSHSTAVEITRQCVTCRIADRQLRVPSGVICHMIFDLLEAFPDSAMIHPFKYNNEFISAVTPCKKLLRNCFPKQNCKRADIFITFIMPHIIVDDPQIIQIKYTKCNQFFLSDHSRIIKDLFTLILIRKSCCFIQINLLLKNSVLCCKANCSDKFCSYDQNKSQNIHKNHFFQIIQSSCFFLRIDLRVPYCFITDLEKLIALPDNFCILVPILPRKKKFTSQFIKIMLKFIHFILKVLIFQTYKIQFLTAIPQTLNVT